MLGVIAAIGMHCRGSSHPKGFIIGMAAVSADAAVFVWRSNDGQPTSWIGRVDGHGDAVWVQPIPNVATSTGGTGPLAIVDGVAVVRYGHVVDYHAIDSSAIAFDLTDGHVLWDHVLTPLTSHKTDDGQEIWPETLPTYVSDVPAGKALFSFAEDGRKYDSVVETRTIARTGAVTWAHPSVSEHFSPIAFGDDLALHYGSTAWLTTGGRQTWRRHSRLSVVRAWQLATPVRSGSTCRDARAIVPSRLEATRRGRQRASVSREPLEHEGRG